MLPKRILFTLFIFILLIIITYIIKIYPNNNNLIENMYNNMNIDFKINKKFDIFEIIEENRNKVKEIDEYLRHSMIKKFRNESTLKYPNEMIDLTKIILNDNYCSEEYGRDLLLIGFVMIGVNGFDRRQSIRESWGQEFNKQSKSRLYFAVGLTNNTTVQKRLYEENQLYDDILQFGHFDDYYNNTIKMLGVMRFIAINCPFAKYMLKVDDDCFVLTKNMLKFCNSTEDNSIFGIIYRHSVVRNGDNKWSIPYEDNPDKYLPKIAAGVYLIPSRFALTRYETAVYHCMPAHPIEDQYFGYVDKKASIKRKALPNAVSFAKSPNCDVLNLDYCYYKSKTYIWQRFNDSSLRKFWTEINKPDVCPSKGGVIC